MNERPDKSLRSDRTGAVVGKPVVQDTIVTECRGSKTDTRVECNRNSGEGVGAGGEIIADFAVVAARSLTTTVSDATI